MKWRIPFICFLPIWDIPIITAKSQEVLTGFRPLQSGDKISTVEMYVLCRKLFEKVNNPGHGKGIVSGAKSPQDLCDTLFERLFFTTKRISTISDMFIPALDALQEIAITVKDSDKDDINRDRDRSDEEYKKTTHYSTWSVGPAQYIDKTEAAKDRSDSSDEEDKKTTHYSTSSVGTAQYIDETETTKDADEGSNEKIKETTPHIEETTAVPKASTKRRQRNQIPDIKFRARPGKLNRERNFIENLMPPSEIFGRGYDRPIYPMAGFDHPIYGKPDADDVNGEPIRCRYTLLTKHDDHQNDLDKSVLKKKQKENDHIKKNKKQLLTRLKFKPVSARKSNLSTNKKLQRDKMEPVDEQVEKVLKIVALLHNTNQNADDEIDRVETLTEYFQKLITIDDLNESTTPKMQPVIHNLGDDDAKDSEGENTEKEKAAFKIPADFLLSDEKK